MSPADWVGLVNGLMLLALTIRMFWGWVFGREHSEANLTYRVTQLEEKVGEIGESCEKSRTDITRLYERLRGRTRS